MTAFDPQDPIPLFQAILAVDYPSAQAHARALDRWLGIPVEETEARITAQRGKIAQEQGRAVEAWVGLSPDALQTPYVELRECLTRARVQPGERVIDLGAAYGRMGFVVERYFPGVEFLGFELVPERVAASQRRDLRVADVASPTFQLPAADVFFLYDFGSVEAVERTLVKLAELARARPIRVIGRGRRVRDIIERGQPWLSGVFPPDHQEHYSIYRSG